MAFDVAGARKAGYSDAEIAEHLASTARFDAKAARDAGYSDSELIAHLVGRADPASKIPGQAPGVVAPPAVAPTSTEPTTLAEKAIGTGEAALSAVTGATGGALGLAGGTIKGVAGAIMNGDFGTPQAANRIEQAASSGMQAMTYQPRTPSGQEQATVFGELLAKAVPAMPLTAELGAAGRAAVPAAQMAGDAAARVPGAVKQAAGAVASTAGKVVGRDPQPALPRGSVGAASTEAATLRRQVASDLPVPIDLTKGQATRDQVQLRFEGETAKDAVGGPLRERYAEQNEKLPQNFEAFIDATGARTTTHVETGRAVVDDGLVKAAARAKTEYKVRYKDAEKAGQMEEPVSTDAIVRLIQENESFDSPGLAPVLSLAQKELVRLGGAELVDGQLVPRDLPLKQMELLRRQIGGAMDADVANATNIRMGSQLKQVIDQSTDGLGGDMYKQARKARQRYAQLYEDNAIVSDLLASRKKGGADRKVALEDVFRRTVLNGSREDLSKLRRTLHVGGDEGRQAWKELQGATVRHLLDEATKGVGTDIRGNPIFSAAKLNNAVRALEEGGKLDFLLSKKGAQQIRDINELAKVIYTMPPGTVNSSNTAGVLMAALAEAGVTGSMTGLPVPVVSGLKVLAGHIKDKKVKARISEALSRTDNGN